MTDVSIVALIVAAIANMALGFVWYGPLFGKQWMDLMSWGKMTEAQIKKMQSEGTPAHIASLIGSLVTAYVLSYFMNAVGAVTLMDGVYAGLWAWIGFVGPVMLGDILYSDKKINLFYLNGGYRLVSLLMMGGILALL